jgi:hypothetical protein
LLAEKARQAKADQERYALSGAVEKIDWSETFFALSSLLSSLTSLQTGKARQKQRWASWAPRPSLTSSRWALGGRCTAT